MKPLVLATALLLAPPVLAAEPYERWPLLTDPFPSTGGGGVMIEGYRPVVSGDTCTTPFTARLPDGTAYRNRAMFDAVPTAGGILCTNGRWQAEDGSASGTTPFKVFIKDGVMRGGE
jgi:hypothetical protein